MQGFQNLKKLFNALDLEEEVAKLVEKFVKDNGYAITLAASTIYERYAGDISVIRVEVKSNVTY